MPYKSREKSNEAARIRVSRYRARKADDAAFHEKEAIRKAAWYEANREKKNENQNRWRQEKREQMLRDLARDGRAAV